ncbi:hypothetical protein H2198_003835 [Neophaeococcomyces mojaviensis]|uniref:Uncharacterized protein n=1 Tax=Neophaeococcomyces mojaviensis TaxID=3383035 RepID=A0ACC3AAB9_9EURO|nr:hypothetical protein H2198_003835 [Knufia sp. JES_112]
MTDPRVALDWLRVLELESSFFNLLSTSYSQTQGQPEFAHSVPANILAYITTSINAHAMISAKDTQSTDQKASLTLLSPTSTPPSSSSQAEVNPINPLTNDTTTNITSCSRQIRRREQNRKAQQAFRRRKEEKLDCLKGEIEQLKNMLESLHQKNDSNSAGMFEAASPVETTTSTATVVKCHFCGSAIPIYAAQTQSNKCEDQDILCDEVYEQQDEVSLQACQEWWQYFASQGEEA